MPAQREAWPWPGGSAAGSLNKLGHRLSAMNRTLGGLPATAPDE